MNVIGSSPPPKPVDGDLWFNVDHATLYIWLGHLEMWAHVDKDMPTVQTKEQFEQWAVDAVTQ